MPPVAAIPANQPDGSTARYGHCARRRVSERNRRTAAALSAEIDRSLQTSQKSHTKKHIAV